MSDVLADRSVARPTDRRTLRTRCALRLALADEIEATGDLSRVTVTAVADRAEITRRTFYSHYKDIPALVSSIEDEVIEDLRPLIADIAATNLDELEESIAQFKPCPGAEQMLRYFKERSGYLAALLGEGGDPAFAEKLKHLVRDVVTHRAAEGLSSAVRGSIFGYYLTFAISAEVGVLIRWLTTGTKESTTMMAGIMTALMFVRPGDLYNRPLSFDVPQVAQVTELAQALQVQKRSENTHELS